MNTCLVFDVFISDKPLFYNEKISNFTASLTRSNIASYTKQSRLDVTLYTLASYEYIGFDSILIFYDIEEKNDEIFFLNGVKEILPQAKIIKGRSTKGSDFDKLKFECQQTGADYFFYAPNNDHPMICSKETFETYKNALEKEDDNINLTLIYSHFQETNFATKIGTWLQRNQFPNLEIIKENKDYKLVKLKDGYSVGMQLVHHSLFYKWCDLATKLGNIPIKRFDELAGYTKLPEQISLVPKQEICRHYDSYYHTMFHMPKLPFSYILPSYVPPLFIPNGFFNKNIKIKFGNLDYDNKYINFLPDADCYVFEKNKSKKVITDIKGNLNMIPGFWLSRISEININSSHKLNKKKIEINFYQINFPFHKISAFQNALIIFSKCVFNLLRKLKNIITIKLNGRD